MSYLVLARKSRPQTFDQVVGQRSVVKTLQNSIRRDRIAHAILFSGVRGVGKTTLARIMAKAINCEGDSDNPPCNECAPCTEITNGNSLDLIEIDGASNRGIQEIRELKEKIKFMPTSCKYKVIIIDEVHMLTTEAFNALLKTLEEPPAHVHFMFATTELHKIPITILSRCQQYELKRIPATELAAHFNRLAEDEGITIDPPALSLIVREAEGSVRDGLSLLDQVFSFGEKHISVADVTEVLGLVDRDILISLSESLLTGDRPGALGSLEDIFAFGMDIKRFSADLLECFRTLLLTRIEGCGKLLDLPEDERLRFSELSARFSPETIHQKLTLLMRMVEDVRYSSQPRLTMETGFLKIIEAGSVVPLSELLGKMEQLLEAAGKSNSAPAPPRPAATQKKTESATLNPAVSAPQRQIHTAKSAADSAGKSSSSPSRNATAPSGPVAPPIPEPTGPDAMMAQRANSQNHAPPPSESKNGQAATIRDSLAAQQDEAPHKVQVHPHQKDIRRHWPDFLAHVKSQVVWIAQALNRAKVKEVGNELQLHYDDPADCSLLKQKANKNQLTEFVLDFFQKELTVRFILPDVEDTTEDGGDETPHQKRQQLAQDPLTIMTAEIFHGQVGDIRIGRKNN
ncbi:DNA polymerase III subunit gamma/tau [Desulfosediminicola ganghwensis]|uniref:DNA polymerase III subunit gamma/tau n=1 Tax=Desulfosediminicola ganghwensis TaxID=2569540 RepID=UPI0010AC4292|nr:DNA polymerase III subunit gamma/tau [Desulfosediminicola ganghwensis]